MPSAYTAQAEALLQGEPDGAVPVLWRSEFRNDLAGYLRHNTLNFEDAKAVQAEPESLLKVPAFACAQVDEMRAWLARDSGVVAVRLIQSGEQRGHCMLHTAAQSGDVTAQYNLRLAYARGYFDGHPQPKQALHWYRRAAEAGHAGAAYHADALLANGAFGAADLQQAKAWMLGAARLQHAGAAGWLARAERR